MTAKVLQFKPRKKTGKPAPKPSLPSDLELFKDVVDEVLGMWQSSAVKDSVDNYIYHALPPAVRKAGTRYVSDLNALAEVELKLKMRVALFCPGLTPANPVGWMAAFHKGPTAYTTPGDMASEGYARAMNVCLFVAFEKTLKSLGRKTGE